MHLVPTSTAAELLRQRPDQLSERLKQGFLSGDSSAVREILEPGDPILQVSAAPQPRRRPWSRKRTWDSTCLNNRSQQHG